MVQIPILEMPGATMNKLYKILIIVFVFLLATISAYGYFHNANKKIDDKDYSSLIVDEDYDNEFEYIEERIIFDSKVEEVQYQLTLHPT